MRDVYLVIFTDLDGTMLDHDTYSFEDADEGLSAACRAGVPVVLCSSKTRAEIEALQCDLMLRYPYQDENDDPVFQPFITENGGALFVPRGYFIGPLDSSRRAGPYAVFEFGRPYSRVVDALHAAASSIGVPVVGFSDMSAEEVAHECGCSLRQAQLAKCREYDEPFKLLSATMSARAKLVQALAAAGLRCTNGGRFEHVMGPGDKGAAVARLKALYELYPGRRVVTVGLGDGLNDTPLLKAVDIPVIVKNNEADATRLQKEVPGAYVTALRGPAGWAHAVTQLVATFAAQRMEMA